MSWLLALGLAADAGYVIETLPTPEGVVLEVGGLALLADGRPMVSTRRGELWIVDGAFDADPEAVRFTQFCEGLHEPLGILVHEGWIYTVQRGELSRLRDLDGDDRADELETVCDAWEISGNYHEYNFGPRLGPDGKLWITTNKPFGGEPFGRADWRGFAVRIGFDGSFEPVCAGLRSPAGIEASPFGEMFYTDNQGEWCGASKLSRLRPGSFHGHPWGLPSCERPEWSYGPVPLPPNGETMPAVAAADPRFELPAVWFPYDKMGRSPAGMVWDEAGALGPFAGQLLVADQHHAAVFRVDLERVDGHWQGACFEFLEGFRSGVLRLAWGPDGWLLAGCTNRGWGSRGNATAGLERVRFGPAPFSIARMRARPDGFTLTLTEPLGPEDPDLSAVSLSSYTYLLHEAYGSPEVDTQELEIASLSVSNDRTQLRIRANGLRPGYVHELEASGLRSASGQPLASPHAYYTLARLPSGSGD